MLYLATSLFPGCGGRRLEQRGTTAAGDSPSGTRGGSSLAVDIRLKLPRGLFMPVARTDLLELLPAGQDRHRAKDIAGLMLGRRLVIPAGLGDDFDTYL